MAMANMNLIGVFVTTLWPVQALACGGDGGRDGGGATKNIISPKFSNFGAIIMIQLYHCSAFICNTSLTNIQYTAITCVYVCI